ncbi:MAG: hypothetical protein SFW67_25995 [Myxococcaceae bacterium]|nr:hypothetical protein [Myxococcaceae bacterium]
MTTMPCPVCGGHGGASFRYELYVRDEDGTEWMYDRIAPYMPEFDDDLEGTNIGVVYSRPEALNARSLILRQHPKAMVRIVRDPNDPRRDVPDFDAYKLDADGVMVLSSTPTTSHK